MTTKKKKTKSFWIGFFNVLSGLPQDERRQEEDREFLYWTLTSCQPFRVTSAKTRQTRRRRQRVLVLDVNILSTVQGYLGLEEDKEEEEDKRVLVLDVNILSIV